MGQALFSRAQNSADISSESLLDLTSALSSSHPAAKIVVIAHSLGARVTLEALRSACVLGQARILWDSLVLLQGAVPAISLHKWEVADLHNESYVESNSGKYADGVKCVGQLIFTCSEKDSTLSEWFQFDATWLGESRPPGGVPTLPLGWSSDPSAEYLAIGSCFDTADKTEMVPKEPESHVTIRELTRIEPRRPSIFSEPGPPDLEAFFIFSNWRIDHPHVHRIHISEKADGQMLDWHSPLWSPRGHSIVSDIWTLVMQEIKSSGEPQPAR
jgi:hypothetical protein